MKLPPKPRCCEYITNSEGNIIGIERCPKCVARGWLRKDSGVANG